MKSVINLTVLIRYNIIIIIFMSFLYNFGLSNVKWNIFRDAINTVVCEQLQETDVHCDTAALYGYVTVHHSVDKISYIHYAHGNMVYITGIMADMNCATRIIHNLSEQLQALM